MGVHRRSREDWEQELWERQLNVTPEEELRAAAHVARHAVDTEGPMIPTAWHLIRLLLGCTLVALGIGVLTGTSSLSVPLGVVLLLLGAGLSVTASAAADQRGSNGYLICVDLGESAATVLS